jgi:hypothetical protein
MTCDSDLRAGACTATSMLAASVIAVNATEIGCWG